MLDDGKLMDFFHRPFFYFTPLSLTIPLFLTMSLDICNNSKIYMSHLILHTNHSKFQIDKKEIKEAKYKMHMNKYSEGFSIFL